MKTLPILSLTTLTIATFCTFGLGCKDGFWTKDPLPDCPEVDTIYPVAAGGDSLVTIYGRFFQTGTPQFYEVRIGETPVDDLKVPNETTMTFKVPKSVRDVGSGAVSVRLIDASCEAANKPAFTYLLTATNVIKIVGEFKEKGSSTHPDYLNNPMGMEVDGTGNIWVADKLNHVVREFDPDGHLMTVVGTRRDSGCEDIAVKLVDAPAHFYCPVDVAIKSNIEVLIAEKSNYTIRKYVSGWVHPYAGKCGESGFQPGDCHTGQLEEPTYIAQHTDKAITYITESGHIRKIDGSNTTCTSITTFVEKGNGLSNAWGIEFSHALPGFGPIFVTDKTEQKIKSVTEGGIPTDIPTKDEGFIAPSALAIDSKGRIFVADEGRNQILVVYPGGLTKVLAGMGQVGILDDRPGLKAQFNAPAGIAIDPRNNRILYVSDTQNEVIRKITIE